MTTHEQIYLDGTWVTPDGTEEVSVPNSTTGKEIGTIRLGSEKDVTAAVEAARTAFTTWSDTPIAERIRILDEMTRILTSRHSELSDLFSQEVGTPTAQAGAFQGLATSLFGMYAQKASTFDYEDRRGNITVLREPIGVVGAITPWNFPLLLMCLKVAPALAVGCTAVLKPAHIAPLSAYALAEAADAAGLPRGVLNVVPGGPRAGEALVAHPDVDMISFTGSTKAGRRISAVAGETIKRVTLELGGKSALVVLDDADLQAAVTTGMQSVTTNNGQGCACLTRVVVPRARLAEAEEMARAFAESTVIGDPRDPATTLGPMASAEHRDRVDGYIRTGIDEGARLVSGGPGAPDRWSGGFFVRPTVFTVEDVSATIAQQEIFGPVQVLIPHDGDDDAARIANATVYGLAGAVFGTDPDRIRRVTRLMRTGKVDINGTTFDPEAPLGGYRQSGNGREFGDYSLEEFLETKAVADLTAGA
ncbi:aldehyde dehydrogenase [Parafrankia sp. EAN1pec]|uniref:aldehyde dehydrogenase family protein n=1 Tax=Parafrankia sp. (strain EAN1pec) TaxID=298653 RepID=UPI00005427D6|nr:aldehyde dehydrogenase [Frankia sp. EAN1pec]